MEAKNIDDLVVKTMQEKAAGVMPTPMPKEQVIESKADEEAKNDETDKNDSISEENTQESASNTQNTENAELESKSTQEKVSDSPIDEYGNPLPAQKTYTEEEVNRMMRERFNRTRQHDQQHVQPQQPETSSEDEPWDITLGKHIRNEVHKMTQEERQRQRAEHEAMQKQEFESKFISGMTKYPDFREVTANKPITDDMIRATSSLNDPAAFIYAAAKLHGPELERIAKIDNSYAQAAEVGRLHERMVKARSIASSAAKPLEHVNSDMPPAKIDNKVSIDERIAQHAKSKRR